MPRDKNRLLRERVLVYNNGEGRTREETYKKGR